MNVALWPGKFEKATSLIACSLRTTKNKTAWREDSRVHASQGSLLACRSSETCSSLSTVSIWDILQFVRHNPTKSSGCVLSRSCCAVDWLVAKGFTRRTWFFQRCFSWMAAIIHYKTCYSFKSAQISSRSLSASATAWRLLAPPMPAS